MKLKDEADFVEPQAPQVAALPLSITQNQLAVEFHGACRRIENAADDVEESGLAGAGGATSLGRALELFDHAVSDRREMLRTLPPDQSRLRAL